MQRQEQTYESESADSAGVVCTSSRGPRIFIFLDSLTNPSFPTFLFCLSLLESTLSLATKIF